MVLISFGNSLNFFDQSVIFLLLTRQFRVLSLPRQTLIVGVRHRSPRLVFAAIYPVISVSLAYLAQRVIPQFTVVANRASLCDRCGNTPVLLVKEWRTRRSRFTFIPRFASTHSPPSFLLHLQPVLFATGSSPVHIVNIKISGKISC